MLCSSAHGCTNEVCQTVLYLPPYNTDGYGPQESVLKHTHNIYKRHMNLYAQLRKMLLSTI